MPVGFPVQQQALNYINNFRCNGVRWHHVRVTWSLTPLDYKLPQKLMASVQKTPLSRSHVSSVLE